MIFKVNKKTKHQENENGFTIVELLVVIVVIAILAAITIVSYTGITAKANSSKAHFNAKSVLSVANAYRMDQNNSGYPTRANLLAYTNYAKIPSGVNVIDGGAGVLSGTNGTTTVIYMNDGTVGGCIGYWDYTGAGSIAYKYVGDATSAALNQASPTCT